MKLLRRLPQLLQQSNLREQQNHQDVIQKDMEDGLDVHDMNIVYVLAHGLLGSSKSGKCSSLSRISCIL